MGEAYRIGHNISKCRESVMQKNYLNRGIVILLIALSWTAAPLKAAEIENALLWRIETANGAVSHLFGTIHSEDSRVLTLPDPVAKAYDDASTLVLELDLDNADNKAMGQAMLLPQGQDLLSMVGTDLYTQSVIALGERGYPEGVVTRLQPWAIVMTLSVPKPETGLFLDYVLYRGAQEQGKKIVGLEKMAEQLAVFTDLSISDQVTLLRDTLKEYKQFPQQFQQLIEVYLQRDLNKLVTLSEEGMTSSDKALQEHFMTALVDKRNRRMAERLAPLLNKGGVFAAVGALHLPGDTGLVALLRKQGLTVTPVY